MERFGRVGVYGPKRCPVYLKLPWIGERSILFERNIKRYVTACFNAAALRVSYSTTSRMNFSLKSPLPTPSRSKVIYLFQCLCEKRYVGRTEQRLADRIKQHVPAAIRKHDQSRKRPVAETQSSAIGKHLCESKPCADAYSDDRFTILDTARSSFHLSTLEATYISTMNPILCRQKSFVYTLNVCKGL